MITTDKLVSRDLAALATESRLQLVPLTRSLRGLEPRDAVIDTRPANRVLVVASHVYAQRLARATAATVCLGAAMWVVYALLDPFGAPREALHGVGFVSFSLQPAVLVLGMTVLAIASYVVTLRLASHLFEWQLRRAVDRSLANDLDDTAVGFATRILERSQRVAVGAEVAGITSVIMIGAIAAFTIGYHGWAVYAFPPLGYKHLESYQATGLVYMLIAVGLSVVGGVITAVVTSRPAMRDYSGRLLAIGIALVLVTAFVGFRFDVGPLVIERAWAGDFMYSEPISIPLRVSLVLAGTIAMSLVVASVMWRRRRNEQTAVAGDARPLGKGDRVVISLAHMFERRVANAAFGATILVCTIAIVILNQQFDGGFNAEYRFGEAFLKQDPMIMIALVVLVGLLVLLVAKRRARRALEHHVQQSSAIMDVRQLVVRADRWAVTLGIGGIVTAIVVFGVYASATDTNPLLFFDRQWSKPWLPEETVAVAAIAIVFVMAIAATIGSRLQRPVAKLAFFEKPTSAFRGMVLGLLTMIVGAYYRDHAGDLDSWVTALTGRVAFAVAGATAVVVVVFGFALARRRRELDALRPDHRG